MKKYLIILFTLISIGINSQNKELRKTIDIIEDLSTFNEEMMVNSQTKTKIIYSENIEKVEIQINLTFVNKKDYFNIFTTFDLNDIIPESAIYDYYKTGDDQYMIMMKIKTKNKSVNKKTVNFKESIPIPVTNTETANIIKLNASGNTMSMYSIKKYIKNVEKLLKLKNCKREIIFKL